MTVLGAVALEGIRKEQQRAQLPLAPGVVVLVAVPRGNSRSIHDRARPMVLVHRDDDDDHAWWVADLTAQEAYGDGRRRTALEDWRASGMTSPSFHFGGRLHKVSVDDVTGRIGKITAGDAETICEHQQAHLSVKQIAVFLAVCS